MALIDYTYFAGVINVDTSTPVTKENILLYSDFCEEKYFKYLLGQAIYSDYLANKTAAKYVDLLKKENFTYNGITYQKDIKTMLANFVYFEFTQDLQSYNTKVGDMSMTSENATLAIPIKKLVRAYNRGVDMYDNLTLYLISKGSDFEGFTTEKLEYVNSFGI